ncbi:Apelin receptor B [Aphelenchoides besseyi]|nr:Apelin receptor B [Aphelenchoides besseyi]
MCLVVAVAGIIIKLGVFGNSWVICSVIRSRRPRQRARSLSPSDRLRTYIALLAIIDLLVIANFVVRILYAFLPEANTDDLSCQIIFGVDRLAKFSSLICLASISVERYISIRKPFNSHVRKRCIQLTPIISIVLLAVGIATIGLFAFGGVHANNNYTDCEFDINGQSLLLVAQWSMAFCFMSVLLVITSSYCQIVRHVRRKFLQRKTRAVVANARSRQPLISEPRYMREMTSAIVRIACFHFLCWLPTCILQLLPDLFDSAQIVNLKLVGEQQLADFKSTAAMIANWLIYVHSALNWVLYAAMNKDLRSIIRATTERRKRSTMSQSSSPNNLHRSLRKHVTQSLRFFYSINSYRSTAGSFDDSMTGQQNQSIESGSPAPVARSISNVGGVSSEGLFGFRNNRAHTYCSPRPSNGIPVLRNNVPSRPILAAIFCASNRNVKHAPERFV